MSYKGSLRDEVKLDYAPLKGESYGWIALSPFAMSGTGWVWSDFNFSTDDILDGQWANYVFPLSSNGMDLATPTNVQAFGINVYGTQVTGTVTIDNIVLLKKDGSADTLATFNKSVTGETEGIIKSYKGSLRDEVKRQSGIHGKNKIRCRLDRDFLKTIQLRFFPNQHTVHASVIFVDNWSAACNEVVSIFGLSSKGVEILMFAYP